MHSWISNSSGSHISTQPSSWSFKDATDSIILLLELFWLRAALRQMAGSVNLWSVLEATVLTGSMASGLPLQSNPRTGEYHRWGLPCCWALFSCSSSTSVSLHRRGYAVSCCRRMNTSFFHDSPMSAKLRSGHSCHSQSVSL